MAALALGFTSCQEDTSSLGVIQTNPQGPITTAEGITVTPAAPYTSTIDLENNVGGQIDIASMTVGADATFPEGTTYQMVLNVAQTEDMANAKKLNIVNNKIEADDLEEIIVAFYNIVPTVQRPWMGISVIATTPDGEACMVGAPYSYFCKQQVNVLPVDEKLDIEDTYYLGGTLSKKLNHSDTHVYLDNEFTLSFTVSDAEAAAGFKWQIVPGSQEANPDPAKCYGPDLLNDKALELGEVGVITVAGDYRLSVDMLKKTYTLDLVVELPYDVIYTPGSANNWDVLGSMPIYTDNHTVYFGFTITGAEGTTDGEFKLSADKDWKDNWGLDGDKLAFNSSNNIKTAKNGLWWIKANFLDLTLSMLKVESMGIIGLNGDWETDIVLAPSADFLTWTGDFTANSDTEFKIRMNGGWDADLGGSVDKLVAGGANIPVAAGSYSLKLDISKTPYTVTLTAK